MYACANLYCSFFEQQVFILQYLFIFIAMSASKPIFMAKRVTKTQNKNKARKIWPTRVYNFQNLNMS